ncbi:MAG: hypothetical protein V5A44_11575 [Haloarculaceae archaeon]
MSQEREYRPAACNIGRGGRRRRLVISALAFGVAVVHLSVCLVAGLPKSVVAGVFVPLAVGFEWAIQASTAFCVRLALLNRYDLRPDGGTGTVSDPAARRADRDKAVKITVVSVGLAAGVTLVVLSLV